MTIPFYPRALLSKISSPPVRKFSEMKKIRQNIVIIVPVQGANANCQLATEPVLLIVWLLNLREDASVAELN